VLKLYPPVYGAECETERAALAAVSGQLPIPTPHLDAVGELDGWRYVLMQRLPGESLATAWPRLDERDRERLCAARGEGLAALHAVRRPELAALGPPSWSAFVRAQRASALERQRAAGLDEAWLVQVPALLDAVALDLDGPPVLLHTEVMREHLLVRPGARGWELCGLFDFEPAMVGAPEYEFASVGVFVTAGAPHLLRALLRGYGYRDDQLDDALAHRLLAYALVHRYANLRWYLERLPAPEAPTLEALARRGWGTR
jgi:hygromycin-B 7''-O-kinase